MVEELLLEDVCSIVIEDEGKRWHGVESMWDEFVDVLEYEVADKREVEIHGLIFKTPELECSPVHDLWYREGKR